MSGQGVRLGGQVSGFPGPAVGVKAPPSAPPPRYALDESHTRGCVPGPCFCQTLLWLHRQSAVSALPVGRTHSRIGLVVRA